MRLTEDFYRQRATELAPLLLGKLLCRSENGKTTKLRITETECYFGEDDTACHAHKGKTPRTQIMYEQGGRAYIYLCYGIHSLLNIVTGDEGFPEAVLIRGTAEYSGPARLTKALNITTALNGIDLASSDILWLEDDGFKCGYKTAKRVGIDYADPKDRDILWRFIAL
ncbi:MAG TPA: 3-methyladenine DNA glycosylase [Ruminococcaceae bacterium]|nr:3-methyladenine DNA glycosylase [Oscillospiraceae bacterium]